MLNQLNVSAEEILICWTIQGEKIKGILAPWLFEEEDKLLDDETYNLRGCQVSEWKCVFETPKIFDKFYHKMGDSLHGENWVRQQLFSPGMKPDFTLLEETILLATTAAQQPLVELCTDLIARTLSLAVRVKSEMKHHEFGSVVEDRIFHFLNVSPPNINTFSEWCATYEPLQRALTSDPKIHDPSSARIKAACAYGIVETEMLHLRPDHIFLVLTNMSVSVSELLCYVALAHDYLDAVHINRDLFQKQDLGEERGNELAEGMLFRTTRSLSEALGPRRNKKPSSYKFKEDDLVGQCAANKLNRVHMLLCQQFSMDPNLSTEFDWDGNGSLIWAARSGNLPIIDLLLAAGVNVNYKSKKGGNAQCWASAYGRPSVCVRLYRAGSVDTFTDCCDGTPLSLVGSFDFMATGSGCKEADKCGTEKVLRAVIAQRSKASNTKKQGNESFIKKDYDLAIRKYKEAILQYGFECPKEKAVCYSNLSQCYINRKDFVLAEMNSKKTLELDHENEKAKMRLKKAQEEMMVT